MYATSGAMVAYIFGPVGREIVIPGTVLLLMEGLSAGIWETVAVSLSVASIDVALALFVLWNFALVRNSRLLGGLTRRLERAFSERLGKHPERRVYALLAGYVAFPFQLSGGFVATIVGSLMGLDPRKLLFSVSLGSVSGSLAAGILAFMIGRPVLDFLSLDILQLAGILIVVGFIIAVVYVYLARGRKADGD